MVQYDFPGKDKMIRAFDAAITPDDAQATTEAIRCALIELYNDPAVQLPACCFEPVDDHYARREIYRSDDLGYSVVAMTWAAEQGTPVHDHSGLWCVESVWQGELEIAQYELLETDGERYRFHRTPCLQACTGSAGRLIPPHEYHTIHNREATDSAISLHIYERPMERSAMFEPVDAASVEGGSGWYLRHCKTLCTDD